MRPLCAAIAESCYPTRTMLDTARLRLIPVGAEHFDALAAMYGDPEVSRFLAGEPLDRAESWWRRTMCARSAWPNAGVRGSSGSW